MKFKNRCSTKHKNCYCPWCSSCLSLLDWL